MICLKDIHILERPSGHQKRSDRQGRRGKLLRQQTQENRASSTAAEEELPLITRDSQPQTEGSCTYLKLDKSDRKEEEKNPTHNTLCTKPPLQPCLLYFPQLFHPANYVWERNGGCRKATPSVENRTAAAQAKPSREPKSFSDYTLPSRM